MNRFEFQRTLLALIDASGIKERDIKYLDSKTGKAIISVYLDKNDIQLQEIAKQAASILGIHKGMIINRTNGAGYSYNKVIGYFITYGVFDAHLKIVCDRATRYHKEFNYNPMRTYRHGEIWEATTYINCLEVGTVKVAKSIFSWQGVKYLAMKYVHIVATIIRENINNIKNGHRLSMPHFNTCFLDYIK